jgi:hypothetical protein
MFMLAHLDATAHDADRPQIDSETRSQHVHREVFREDRKAALLRGIDVDVDAAIEDTYAALRRFPSDARPSAELDAGMPERDSCGVRGVESLVSLDRGARWVFASGDLDAAGGYAILADHDDGRSWLARA